MGKADTTSTASACDRFLPGVVGFGLIVYAAVSLWNFPPIIYPQIAPPSARPTLMDWLNAYTNVFRAYWVLTGVMFAMACIAVFATPRISRILFAGVLGCFVLAGFWVVRTSPQPLIDVWVTHQYSCQAISEGKNPYAITYPDIYGPGSRLMDPAAVKNGQVQSGYNYPPLTLLMSLPGFLVDGDYRYANVFAIALTALFLGLLDKRVGILAGMLLLLMPHTLFVIEQGWTEAHVLLLLVAFAWCAIYRPRLAPWVFGLFLASKQHLFLTLPLGLLALPRGKRSIQDMLLFEVQAVVAAAMVTVPFVMWDAAAFDRSVLGLFHGGADKIMVERPDSVTIFGAMLYYNWGKLPGIASPIALLATLGLCLATQWKSRFAVSACILSIAVTLLAAHAFSHHAFCNHYYLIFGALLGAAAAQTAQQQRQLPAEFVAV